MEVSHKIILSAILLFSGCAVVTQDPCCQGTAMPTTSKCADGYTITCESENCVQVGNCTLVNGEMEIPGNGTGS